MRKVLRGPACRRRARPSSALFHSRALETLCDFGTLIVARTYLNRNTKPMSLCEVSGEALKVELRCSLYVCYFKGIMR